MKQQFALVAAAIMLAVLGNLTAQSTFAQEIPVLKDVPFTVKLLSPISTLTGHQGDAFSASVDGPAQFQGGIVTGKITKVKTPEAGVGKGKAEIQFVFDSLTYGGRSMPIAAVLQDVSNSKGVRNVDEEGQVVGKTSNKKRVGAVLGGAMAGALIGGLSGGAGGAAIGAAAGGGAGLIIGLTMTTTGSQIVFQPGSVFTLKVSNGRSGAK